MRIGLFLLLLMISGCIGLDTRDDAIRDIKFSIVATTKVIVTDEAGNLAPKGSIARLALLAGEKEPILTEFLNKYGVKEAKSLVWTSSMPSVGNVTNNEAVVKQDGLLMEGISHQQLSPEEMKILGKNTKVLDYNWTAVRMSFK